MRNDDEIIRLTIPAGNNLEWLTVGNEFECAHLDTIVGESAKSTCCKKGPSPRTVRSIDTSGR
jgi:hypothetical protein